jgi:hypothetical protein
MVGCSFPCSVFWPIEHGSLSYLVVWLQELWNVWLVFEQQYLVAAMSRMGMSIRIRMSTSLGKPSVS